MRLYKYCNPKGILILQNQCIKFLDVTASNDPFECKPFISDSPEEVRRLKNEIYKEPFITVHHCASPVKKGR